MKTQNPIKPYHKFGKLTVIKKDPFSPKYRGKIATKWLCQCECGKMHSASASNLKKGDTTSCGCSRSDWSRKRTKNKSGCWKGYEDISGTFWSIIKSGAKARKIPFDLKIEEAWQKLVVQNFKCAFTKEQLILAKTVEEKKRGIQTASLDRIDATKGYSADNIQWVHVDINKIKIDMSNNEFVAWCQKITKYNKHDVS